MRAFFAVVAEEQQAGVVLLREEFQRGGVGERVDVVFLGEADAVRAFEGVQVGQEGGDQGGARGAAEEEGRFGVFGTEGFAGFEGAGGAGGFGFSSWEVSRVAEMDKGIEGWEGLRVEITYIWRSIVIARR